MDSAYKLLNVLLTSCVAVVPACRRDATDTEFMRGQSMEAECDAIARNSALEVEFDRQQGQIFVRFTNKSDTALWFPADQQPAFRPDERANALAIWFGYFEEVYGDFRSRYMVPAMHSVPSGTSFRIQLTTPGLVQKLLEQRLKPLIKARIAIKEIAVSRVRGNQPLEDYLQYSCIIESR